MNISSGFPCALSLRFARTCRQACWLFSDHQRMQSATALTNRRGCWELQGSKFLNLPYPNPGLPGRRLCVCMPKFVSNNNQIQSSASAGEALQGLPYRGKNMQAHPACLAQRSTELPKKSFFCGPARTVAQACHSVCWYERIPHAFPVHFRFAIARTCRQVCWSADYLRRMQSATSAHEPQGGKGTTSRKAPGTCKVG